MATAPSSARPLTPGERRRLSPGLLEALTAAGAKPVITARAHPAAQAASLWRGPTVMTRGDTIFWPGAPVDASAPGREADMALLQHELQHVLEYRQGRLTALGYLLNPRDWIYAWSLIEGRPFAAYGAEQRASMVEALWRLQASGARDEARARLEDLIPWAQPSGEDAAEPGPVRSRKDQSL